MVGYHDEPPSGLQRAGGARQELLERAHLVVDLYPEGLVDAGELLVLGE